jgi:predicted amidohydrolase/ribosomal protein S18 acetylase RimI-like enzyme
MSKRPTPVRIRQATRDDISALIELNRIAYPVLADENVVWGASHLKSHLRIFPEGQLVAEVDSRIVGAVASLIVSLGRDPLRLHTWSGITDSGYFTNHDPEGDTLYGADVYVDPDCRGRGVGAALYEARRTLCRRLNKRRILAGGRLWNYDEHSERISPEEYVEKVLAGELRDLVLSFQLKEGFVVRGVLPNYLRDPKSRNFASLIEWLNPDYKAATPGARKVRVACVQYQMRKVASFEDFAGRIEYFIDVASDYGADFVLLPELVSMQLLSQTDTVSPREGIQQLTRYTKKFVRLMRTMSKKFGLTIIAGSHPVLQRKKIFNVSFICLPNGEVIQQSKLHITPNERKWWGISGGRALAAIETPKARIGVLICYDIEFPEAARHLADQGAEIIFVPFCTDNRQGYYRVRYCAHARAIENQIYVALAGNVGNLPDVANMDIQYGQACVLTPSDFAFARDGIAAEADTNEETVLICDLDLDDLYQSRNGGTVTPRLDRRPDLFRIVSSLPNYHPPEEAKSGGEGPLGDQIQRLGNDGAPGPTKKKPLRS